VDKIKDPDIKADLANGYVLVNYEDGDLTILLQIPIISPNNQLLLVNKSVYEL
jgi:hypothetical protein